MNIEVSEELKSKCPEFKGVAVEAWVTNTSFSQELWQEIDAFTRQLRTESNVDDCKEQYAIAATRTAYRRCGKDPSRYRPSAEALRRRLLRGLDLYQIEGDRLILGIGREGEPYEGIGRGVLNIDGLPVYRDAIGGIGTPTSDHERTKMDIHTVHLLAIINGYSGEKGLQEAAELTIDLLKKYASLTKSKVVYFE